MSLLEIKNLKLDFISGERSLRAVDDVSLTMNAGETVCLVGESGCGKTSPHFHRAAGADAAGELCGRRDFAERARCVEDVAGGIATGFAAAW